MKKVIIIGASGSLEQYVIEELQKRKDVQQTLFLRNKKRLENRNLSDATIAEGDVTDYQKLKDAINGQAIVYVNLAGKLEAVAKNIVKAMQETAAKRIIAISSIGICETPLRPVLQAICKPIRS